MISCSFWGWKILDPKQCALDKNIENLYRQIFLMITTVEEAQHLIYKNNPKLPLKNQDIFLNFVPD